MGGGLAVFFKDGPFAWNGIIGFYVPLTVFAIWVLVTTFVLTKAIKRQAAEDRAGRHDRRSRPRRAQA